MVYQMNDVVADVRVALDQNMTDEELVKIEDIDTLSLDEIIRSKVTGSVDAVQKVAPYYMLGTGHSFGEAVYWEDQESGWVLLPGDFMRLKVFEMSDWERAVYRAISPDEPEYRMQRQRVKALRGTAQKPVCAICVRPEGLVLEFYSCKSEGAYVSRGEYIPYAKIDNNDGIDISERCYKGVVYMIASEVLATLGETEKSKVMNELSNRAIQ